MTRSCVYEGELDHRRLTGRRHAFRMRLALAFVDLDEVGALLDGRLTRPGFGVWRYRRGDYFGDAATPLAEAIRAHVRAKSGVAVDGPVRLLTQLRFLGRGFNPVSFYYCYDLTERVVAVVAEVTNTPWGERHAYVLVRDESDRLAGAFPKRMHVSPFFGTNQTYVWRATEPAETLHVSLGNVEAGDRVFDASIRLARRPLDAATLRRLAWRYPAGSIRTLALIYAHALVLRAKGVPVVPHPGVPVP